MNRPFKIGLLLLTTFVFISFGFSQTHTYQHYGVENGLPSSELYSAFQDSKGRICFGTFNNQLRYYNNNSIYKNKQNNEIEALIYLDLLFD